MAVAAFAGCLGTEKSAEKETVYRMRGDFRKGPFAARGDVRVSMLNRRGEPSGKNYQTATENDSGDFSLTLPGGVAEFACTGRSFDEVLGALTNQDLRLVAVAQVPEDGKRLVHANAFTHLSAPRIRKLMAQGRKWADAVSMAEKELRAGLGIANAEGTTPYAGASLDLLGGNNPHTLYLFAVSSVLGSAALQKAGGRADLAAKQMQVVLDSLASDLEADGRFAPASKELLAMAEKTLDPARARKGLEAWSKLHGGTAAFPDLSKVVDNDKDGKPNDQDPDDDGDMVSDELDCAPLDSGRQMVSVDGLNCVAMYAPSALVAAADDAQATLVWDDLPGSPTYTLYRCQGDQFDSAVAAKLEGAKPGQVVTGLENGKPYWFALSLRYGDRISPITKPVRTVPVGIATGFGAVPGTGKVTLTWSPVAGATAYNLYFRAGQGVDKADTKIPGVTSPFVINSLKDGLLHSFALASVSSGSESRLGDTVAATPVQPPAKTHAASGDRMIVVTWDTASGATGYDVLYGKGDTLGTDALKRANRTSPDTITGLANGTRYVVRVQSTVKNGFSDPSVNASTIPLGSATGLKAIAGTGRMIVDWKAAEGATSYMIYYWTGKNPVQRASVVTPPASLKSLSNGITWYVRVTAANAGYESQVGDTLAAIPLAPPESLKTVMQDGAMDFSWAPVPGATGYTVFYNQGPGVDTTHSKTLVKDTKLSLGGLQNDAHYALIVRSENLSGHSDIGATAHALPMKPPANFTAQATADKVTLRWEEAPGAQRYNVYYRKASSVDKTGLQVANLKSGQFVTGLENGELYSFAVEAIKEGFAGPLSESRSVIYIASTLKVGGAASDSVASYLSLALDANDNPWLAFVDMGRTLAERNLAKVVTLENGAWVAKGQPSLTVPYTCCTLNMGPGDTPYIGFGDGEQGNRLTVKAWDGSSWSAVGGPAVTDAKAEFIALAMDALGIPYVAYNDSAKGGRVSVRRLEGSKWTQVGIPGFSTNASGPLSLALSKANQPLLSSGGSGSIAAAVMGFDGKTWNTTGDVSAALSNAAPGPIPLAVSPSNQVYVGLEDKSTNLKTTVLSTTGTNWARVGTAGFSDGSSQSLSLAIDGRGMPYLAFADDSRAGRISVMRFEGGAWAHACLPGFSNGRATFISLAIGKSGSVYVAFQDAGDGGRAQVVKLNGP